MLDQINPRAQAGRGTGTLRVQEAKRLRMDARHTLGGSREDPPSVAAILRAAGKLNELLRDATGGKLKLMVQWTTAELEEESAPPTSVLTDLLTR